MIILFILFIQKVVRFSTIAMDRQVVGFRVKAVAILQAVNPPIPARSALDVIPLLYVRHVDALTGKLTKCYNVTGDNGMMM